MIFRKKPLLALLGVFPALAGSTAVYADLAYNLVEPAATITREIFDLHMLTARVSLYIMIIVTLVLCYMLLRFRKSAGAKTDENFNHSFFGVWGWLLVPILVLGIDFNIAGPGTATLNKVEEHVKPDMTLKVIGSQWKWTYDYMDYGFSFTSNLTGDDITDEENYLRAVDRKVILPTNRRIRFLHTATDVLHAWWVPAIAYKKDSIPGYITETWTNIEKEGIYHGQCAELCGTRHAYMPIVVEAVSPEKFDAWVKEQQSIAKAAAEEAASNKVWTHEELMTRGEELYVKNCAGCHQVTGAGLPPAFPALKGSAIATGSVADHLNIVIKGKPGTAMAAWGAALNDLELAAIITYERNAWENNTGDTVQPADVKASR